MYRRLVETLLMGVAQGKLTPEEYEERLVFIQKQLKVLEKSEGKYTLTRNYEGLKVTDISNDLTKREISLVGEESSPESATRDFQIEKEDKPPQ